MTCQNRPLSALMMGVEGSSKIKRILKNTFKEDTNKQNEI
jgi:hypothetical protein